ncbi:MAG: site-specific integrase [Pseudomonadota bacterium]
MNELAGRNISEYIAMRKEIGRSNATINRELALLSAAINYANREWDWELPNVVAGRKLKEAEGRVRWLTINEYQSLLEAASQEPHASHLAGFIKLATHTGCRSGELLGLEWSRIDLESGIFFLEGHQTKSGKRRSIPLNSTATRVLEERDAYRLEYCPDSPWVFCRKDGSRFVSFRKSFNTARIRAGLNDFRIHDLRHTCAAWLVSNGVPLTEVRDLLGHSTVKMTERYAHLAPENVRAAVNRLDDWSRLSHITNNAALPISGH